MNWARTDISFKEIKSVYITNHHPNCQYVNDSLIDVWRISFCGSNYVLDREPTKEEIESGEIVTKEKMHQEIYDHLEEFDGF